MDHSPQSSSSQLDGSSRRQFLKWAAAFGASLALVPTLIAAPANNHLFYTFVNKTNGRWTDAQCFWSLNDGAEWHSFADAPTVPCPQGGGRLYFHVGTAPDNFDDRHSYWDFIEWNYQIGGNWSGNTTQVDAFCLPLTIELDNKKVGIEKSRDKLFKAFLKDCPAEFRDCVKEDFWILSPARAGFRADGLHGNYFDDYVNQIWETYAKKKETPSGQFTGEVTDKGVLVYTPVGGGTALTCESKPSTQDILLGEGGLQKNAAFCAAFNRHVAADPADWKDPSKFYKAQPCNWYSKFLHEQAIDHKCYGFCYDDSSEQAAYFSRKAQTLIVTLYWS